MNWWIIKNRDLTMKPIRTKKGPAPSTKVYPLVIGPFFSKKECEENIKKFRENQRKLRMGN